MGIKSRRGKRQLGSGVGQLSLVEHALCPVDSRGNLVRNSVFETGYYYTDNNRRRKRANVRVLSPLGLTPQDELYLWGLLSLTFAQSASAGDLRVTRHYILRQLGILKGNSKGGRQYADFAKALKRLSCVQYQNDAFYDPVRAEHRRVGFGFLSYSMPLNEDSSRAWQIAWDPLFLELVKPAGGMMRFSLPLYRSLDVASRRLFLFLAKMFRYRLSKTHPLELRHLGIDILGYSPTLNNGDLKIRINRAILGLKRKGLLSDLHAQNFAKNRKGKYVVSLYRGQNFNEKNNRQNEIESPFDEQLKIIGFDDRGVSCLTRQFPHRLLSEWIDITLAAKERFGMTFFKNCPAAYLQDNLKQAANGTRTPPDWWCEIRKVERIGIQSATRSKQANGKGVPAQHSDLPQKALGSMDDLQATIFSHFLSVGQPKSLAQQNTVRFQSRLKKQTK